MERCRDDGNINSGSTSAGAAVNDATPPPPPPQRNTDEDLRRTPAPKLLGKVLTCRVTLKLFSVHLMNFNNDVPGADSSRS